jgi:hypothetical protein
MNAARYWDYWKRGWWVLLLIACINVTLGLAYVLASRMLGQLIETPLPVAAVIVWLIVGAPFCGWLFEGFVAKSKRLGQTEPQS